MENLVYSSAILFSCSSLDTDRLTAYNQELSHNRGASIDWSQTLPMPSSKVQFGENNTHTYFLPE